MLSLKHIWISALSIALAIFGFIFAFIAPEFFVNDHYKNIFLYVYMALFYLFIFGIFMIVSFPNKSDVHKFSSSHRLAVIGFFVASLAFPAELVLEMIALASLLKYVGLGIMVYGLFRIYLRV